MLNFEYYNPTHLVFGRGQMAKLPDLIPINAKIILVYGGGSIFNNGIYQQVVDSLSNYEITEFGGIEPNPHYETLLKAVKIIRDKNIDFILAVGGGSVIDGAKFISAAATYDGDSLDILKGQDKIKNKVIPLGTVLTLPATGSEMNSGSVITIEATDEKLFFDDPAVFPQFSICDPQVIASLPERQLQNGVVDAFTHVMEQYLTYPSNAFLQDRIAEGILQTLIEVGPEVVKRPTDYTLASNFMWSCTMALNGLIQKGVPADWVTHLIGHELTALYGIDHARTLAVIAPSLYKVMFESKKQKLAQYGRRVWGIDNLDEEIVAKLAINKTIEFLHTMGMETGLSYYTDDYKNTASLIVNRFEQRGWTALGELQNVTPDKVKEIIELSY
ncbi:iron-containing alcohol dehydrogenase [Chryseobacterium tongliaoense]|uniref:iron-containing alcohol dehydrogenase n=1 Tax=Chryseobacterium tongliaoense TaxID=3240933 RepID=UPI003513E80F